ncbi:hypothetical protein PtA15_12A440 [Puccinia triticina]|uniref:Uncharacterized protein n=1 Tax=Puccinia triticina TaxID=208348 RepID=A0ABY7CZ28_9BASI|nr:uncharacterized protein PtA15_12A440 [Puccinia triticina]WAQ90451.1 hypothetical protein PtA15_12A440 [Puccinia triticina]
MRGGPAGALTTEPVVACTEVTRKEVASSLCVRQSPSSSFFLPPHPHSPGRRGRKRGYLGGSNGPSTSNSRRRSDDGPAFCVRNGCAKHGVVGWMPPEHERPVRLIQPRRPPPLTPEHPSDKHQLVAGLQALALPPPRENDALLADLGGELRHPVGCAHLVARTMWDVDSW